MTRVVVHRDVARRDLPRLQRSDPDAARALSELIGGLASSTRGGVRLETAGWRVYVSVPGYGVVATGVGTGTVRVIAAGPLPALYDRDRLRQMAAEAQMTPSTLPEQSRAATVPSPALRSRVVALDEVDGMVAQRGPAGPSR